MARLKSPTRRRLSDSLGFSVFVARIVECGMHTLVLGGTPSAGAG